MSGKDCSAKWGRRQIITRTKIQCQADFQNRLYVWLTSCEALEEKKARFYLFISLTSYSFLFLLFSVKLHLKLCFIQYLQGMFSLACPRRGGSGRIWILAFTEEVVQSSPNTYAYGRGRYPKTAAWAVLILTVLTNTHFLQN